MIERAAGAIPLIAYGIYLAGGAAVGYLGVGAYEKHKKRLKRNEYDEDGFGPDGFNVFGKDREGYNRRGFKDGFNRQGLDASGYAKDGFNLEGLDRAGKDRSHYADVISNLDKRIDKAHEQRRYDKRNLEYVLLEVRLGLEEGVQNWCQHWKGSVSSGENFARVLDQISKNNLEDEIRNKLKGAYRICSQGLHHGDCQEKNIDQVTFCIYTLKELRELIASFAGVDPKYDFG